MTDCTNFCSGTGATPVDAWNEKLFNMLHSNIIGERRRDWANSSTRKRDIHERWGIAKNYSAGWNKDVWRRMKWCKDDVVSELCISSYKAAQFEFHCAIRVIFRHVAAHRMSAGYAVEVKLFGKWSFEDITVKDISLEDYIACKPKFAQFLPHSQGRWQKKRFRKAHCPIVERLVCSMMRHGRNNGKKLMAMRIVKHAFEIIHLLTDQNPVQVYVEAVINCGPREDSTRVGGGGAVRRQACDVSPLRRVNTAIYLLTTGAREASFRNIKTIAECLADEIMNAAKGSSNSYAIKRKDEVERVAKSNR